MKSGYQPENPHTVTVTLSWSEIQKRIEEYGGKRRKKYQKILLHFPEICAMITGGTIIGLESLTLNGYPLGSQSAKGKYKPENLVFVDGPKLRQHVRKYVKARNPNSPAQVINRDLFRRITKQYKELPLSEKEQWDKVARTIQPTWSGINLYLRTHL